MKENTARRIKEIHREVGQYRDKPMSKVFEGREGQQQINALMDKLRRNILMSLQD